ncbi:MAG: ATPase, T2SS/T4P/T4SS family [Francisellaceae bacterium]
MSELLCFTPEPSYFTLEHFNTLMLFLHHKQVSDITIQSGEAILTEKDGLLHHVTHRRITHQELSDFINHIYGANASALIQSGVDLDTSYQLNTPEYSVRFRVNITACLFRGYHGTQVTLRVINSHPPELKDMGLDDQLTQYLNGLKGVVVISGATGSGKSTLLASLIRSFVEDENNHLKVLTYESPIEYTYDHINKPNSIVSQSEIPRHLPNFAAGVRNALRRKPGLILLGEARDGETISAVIEAALTGHPVYTTVHANGAIDTLRRMLNATSQANRSDTYYDLISTIELVLWQALVPKCGGGRIPIREYLYMSPSIKEKLLSTQPEAMNTVLQKLLVESGQPLSRDVKLKWVKNLITKETAMRYLPEMRSDHDNNLGGNKMLFMDNDSYGRDEFLSKAHTGTGV